MAALEVPQPSRFGGLRGVWGFGGGLRGFGGGFGGQRPTGALKRERERVCVRESERVRDTRQAKREREREEGNQEDMQKENTAQTQPKHTPCIAGPIEVDQMCMRCNGAA